MTSRAYGRGSMLWWRQYKKPTKYKILLSKIVTMGWDNYQINARCYLWTTPNQNILLKQQLTISSGRLIQLDWAKLLLIRWIFVSTSAISWGKKLDAISVDLSCNCNVRFQLWSKSGTVPDTCSRISACFRRLLGSVCEKRFSRAQNIRP